MCGIAGLYDGDGSKPPQRRELDDMAAALHHRGPDGRGVWMDGPVGLAHTRLAIIDLDGGAQPMASADGRWHITFNGEIFNHVELRAELQALGRPFRTRSDTEVIIQAWDTWGEACLDRFVGQFAFGLWDGVLRRLHLARDRAGVRPLFVARDGARLAFASEMKAFFAAGLVRARLDARALASVFSTWTVQAPRTPFEGIEQLPPGHVMTVDSAGVRTRRWWDWPFGRAVEAAPSLDEAALQVREAVREAVALRLRADVPVGAYLSGGLDSSLIAALVAADGRAPLRTFSVRFDDAAFDEGAYQQALVQKLGTRHTDLICKTADIGACFPRVVFHGESPVLRTAAAPLYLLAERVRHEGYKVVLTGEGADEVFAGYDLFKEAKVRRFWARFPKSSVRPRLLEKLYPWLAGGPGAAPAFARAFYAQGLDALDDPLFAHGPRFATARRAQRFFGAAVRDQLNGYAPEDELRSSLPEGVAGWEPLARDQVVEARTLLPGYLLSSQGDRVSLAHGVEGRFPFLDHRVIALAGSLPATYRMRALREKAVLKRAAEGLVPEVVVRRPKQPYRAPDAASFFADGRPLAWVGDLLSPARVKDGGYFEPAAVDKLREKCAAGEAAGFGDNMAFVGVLSTMLLDELFVRGRSVV